MFILKKKVKDDIEKKTGLSVSQIASMSSEEINKHLEQRLRKKMKMGRSDHRFEARGSVYINLGRFLSQIKRDKKLGRI